MANLISETIAELEKIAGEARGKFGALSGAQINWKPNAESWSVGQCLEHLVKSNELFYDELARIASGARANSFWENWSPLTGFGGRLLIKSLRSDEKKFKAPTPKIVPPSEVDPRIVENFAAHQAELGGRLEKCAAVDTSKTVVTSPFVKFVTYSFADGLTVIVEHEKRHLRQAGRVAADPNFPK